MRKVVEMANNSKLQDVVVEIIRSTGVFLLSGGAFVVGVKVLHYLLTLL